MKMLESMVTFSMNQTLSQRNNNHRENTSNLSINFLMWFRLRIKMQPSSHNELKDFLFIWELNIFSSLFAFLEWTISCSSNAAPPYVHKYVEEIWYT